MALVTISGLPSSGRSTRASELRNYFEEMIKSSSSSSSNLPTRVVVISDEDVHIPRSAYSNQRLEKPARASYLSAVQRALDTKTIVIADGGAGLNIKGFRYQLWCSAREFGVRCVTIHVHASPDVCRSWNKRRREDRGGVAVDHVDDSKGRSYDDETIDSMMMRYEEPNAMTRWDSPLFLVSTTLIQGELRTDPLPLQDIWQAVTLGSVKKAPGVVAPQRSTTTNYLSLLESGTQAVLNTILSEKASLGGDGVGGSISLSLPPPITGPPIALHLPVGNSLTLSSLQRLRRQFVRMHSSGFAGANDLGSAARSEDRGNSAEWWIAKRFAGFLEEAL